MIKRSLLSAVVISAITLTGCATDFSSASTDRVIKDCGYEVFSGLTKDHRREVRICLFSENNNNYVNFYLDDVGKPKKPHMDVHVQDVFWGHVGNSKSPGEILIVTDGTNSFSAAKGVSGGRMIAFIGALDGENEVRMELDPNTVKVKTKYQNGQYSLWDFGIGVYSKNSAKRNEIRVLAPAI